MIRGSILNRHRRAGRRGFTLIEILVVLVVLLIGILALLRLFPGGFLMLQRSSEMTNGQALAAQQLDAVKNLLSPPESIIPTLPDANGNMVAVPTVPPDDLTDFTSATLPAGVPAGWDPYYLSNVNRIRTVIGETFRIPIPTPNTASGTYGAIYMLPLGPVYNKFGMDASNNPTDSIAVHGVSMQRIEQKPSPGPPPSGVDLPDPNLVMNNEAQYAIDYDDALIAFYPRQGTGSRQFTINYSYYIVDTSGMIFVQTPVIGPSTTITVPDVATIPPGGLFPIWQPIFNTDGLHPNSAAPPTGYDPKLGMVRNSDDVSRKFRLMTSTTVLPGGNVVNWDANDPYEYAWFSEQKADLDPAGTHVNAGVLVFNPIGHNEVVQTSAGPQTLTARVDYTTFDNHILREDRSIPSSAPYDVRLSVPFVLTNGDVLDDGTTYNGMFRDPNNATSDLLIYNAATGEEIGEQKNGVVTTGGDFIGFTLDARAGILRLNKTDVENKNLQSTTLHFFYRAQKQWGMQVQKANTHYILSQTDQLGYNNFYVGATDATSGGQLTRIYFPLCEAGKTVIIGEYVVSTSASDPTQYERITNEQFKINDDPSQFEKLGNNQLLTWIDVSLTHPEAISFNDDPTGQAVSNMQGISLRSRALWKSSQRWRRVDTDTLLVAPSTR